MKTAILILVSWLALFAGNAYAADRAARSSDITAVFIDVAHIRHDAKSNGDTWDHIWAEDDQVYSFSCDGVGYGAQNNNTNFSKLTGSVWNQLTGSPVNPMSDYGKNMQRIANGSNWKVTGADCIDGMFYAFIADNWYGNQNAFGGAKPDPYLRQTVNNMSLIKSTDKGRTWSRPVKDNIERPMWTDRRFSTAFFFKFGRNGGSTRQDDQDKFVYAISNDGYWNCGSAFYLGRVPRAKIRDLNAADWQYFSDGKWTSDLKLAAPVPGLLNGQNKCTMGSPVWLSPLRRYVTVTWFDPCTTTKWHYPEDVTFAFYQAEHPWGPWSYIGAKSAMEFIGSPGINRVSRWYGPSLSPKFIAENPDGSVTVILLFSGQTWENKSDSLYKNNSCPVTFYTQPLPRLRETVNDTAAKFSDGWRYEPKRGVGDFQDDVHVTVKTGSYCDYEFTGEGIEILSEKFHNMGEVEVLLDGQSQGRFNLYQDPMPRLYQIPLYRKLDLAKGRHTVRVINRAPDGVTCMVDGFKVYGEPGARSLGQEAKAAGGKTFIDYFLPIPIVGSLSKDVWGAPEVGPRDPNNGLEDTTVKQWYYWDGQIIKGPDGRYHMFASRWDQAKGHRGWVGSNAVHAVSNSLFGPYVDKGPCWPNSQGGKGHNVTALVLPDGRYAVVISETRPGAVFASKSLDGPWEELGTIKGEKLRASNISIMVRPDGDYMIVPRSGHVFISKAADGILGPYQDVGPAFPKGIPNLEDPVIWHSGGLYHIVVNSWSTRKAYHLTSKDGKTDWVNRGLAYDPTKDFIRYTDGTVNHWHKLERPGVLLENGHVTAVTLAVLDIPKEQQKGNDPHGSKILVIPFDGAALDRGLQSEAAGAK